MMSVSIWVVFEWESEDGQKNKSFFRRNNKKKSPLLQRKTDQLLLLCQVYKAVEEKEEEGRLVDPEEEVGQGQIVCE